MATKATDISRSPSPSPSPTIVQNEPTSMSDVSMLRKTVLLIFFSIAQFIDVCNVSAIFTAIPIISQELDISASQSVWLTSAYQLTFASFLLLSGRMSDLYNPKILFNVGFGALGVISLITGFVRQKIALIVLRALSGIAAALTIPSALSLIVHLYPDPKQQARAISIFGGTGAIGNIMGQIIGAVFVQLATWHWIFWFNSIIAIPIAVACVLLIPSQPAGDQDPKSGRESSVSKFKRLDIIGVSMLTLAFILLIFALTSGSTDGWSSGKVLGPLITSVILVVVFFVYETRIPADHAALPPYIWFYPNFAALFGVALLPYLWWTALFLLFTTFWQDVVHWSPVLTAVHFLPNGIIAFCTIGLLVPYLQGKFKLKTIIITGLIFTIPATILLALADKSTRYWSFNFPAFFIGTGGLAVVLTNINIAMFKATPPELAGIVGAIFNGALQLGAAVGVAAITTIETNVENKHGGTTNFKGRAAGFWFLLAVILVELIAAFLFFHDREPAQQVEKASADSDLTEKTKVAPV